MRKKSKTSILLPQFQRLVENYSHTKIISFSLTMGESTKCLYLFSILVGFLISHLHSHPSEMALSNGAIDMLLKLVFFYKTMHHFSYNFWSHASQAVVYLLSSSVLYFKTPYEMLSQWSPNYQHLKPFGCLCFPWLCPYNISKLQPRSFLVSRPQYGLGRI